MPVPTRAMLEAMKRSDLQRLCKDYGVKANLKTEALIHLLLDAHSGPGPLQRTGTVPKPPVREPPMRSNSIIVHDLPEVERGPDDYEGMPEAHIGKGPSSEDRLSSYPTPTAPLPVLVPPPRTRKAKETQYRLGVGRPVVAGGQGARVVTRSRSTSKAKRLRNSRTIKPSDVTIMEEEAEVSELPTSDAMLPPDTSPRLADRTPESLIKRADNSISRDTLEIYVKNELGPLYEQIQALKAELEQMQSLQAELQRLKVEVGEINSLRETVTHLTAQVQNLQQSGGSLGSSDEEMVQIEHPSTPKPSLRLARKSTGPGGIGIWGTLQSNRAGIAQGTVPVHGSQSEVAQALLGKRHRATTPVDTTEGNVRTGMKTEDRLKVPLKKRAKAHLDAGPSIQDHGDVEGEGLIPRGPPFKVFTGSDGMEIDEPPNLLPIPQGESSVTGGSVRQTSTANASENQNSFNFPFLPVESTPVPVFMASFPYPEPPQTPTPDRRAVGQHGDGPLFGLTSRSRAPPPNTDSERGFVNPASLTRKSSNDKGKGVATSSFGVNPPSSSTTDACTGDEPPPIKRTMYGTEMDGDSRFSDFGMDSITSQFWNGHNF